MNIPIPGMGSRPSEAGRAPMKVLGFIFVLLVLAAVAFWFYRSGSRSAAVGNNEAEEQQLVALSDSTRAVLQRLASPIEIRFYSILDPASVFDASRAYAGRVDKLLSAYEREGNGKVKVTRYRSLASFGANAPEADGVKVFNLDKGGACCLGIAVALGASKESLPQLAPEWEQALEADLTRAIVRLLDATRPAPVPVAISQSNTSAVQAVKALFPNLAAVSVEEGTRLLRSSSLKELQEAIRQMDLKVKEAEQQLVDAQTGKSAAEQQAALKRLQEVHTERMQQLKEVAAKAQAQMQAFQRLKAEKP